MRRQEKAFLPTKWGEFHIIAYAAEEDEPMPHLAMVSVRTDIGKPVNVRIHSECMTGDLFGSNKCDCGEQLDAALQHISQEGGVLIYLRQEGRGIGIINKLRAYNLQAEGMNTIDANVHLGLEIDGRSYEIAIAILEDLGIKAIRLLTNNPEKIEAIAASSIELIERIPLVIPPKKENQDYLDTKQNQMGHLFE